VEIFCDHCAEIFCRDCANATHQRGRMATHQLHAYSASEFPGGTLATADYVQQTQQLGKPQRQDQSSQLLDRRFLRCPTHPEEPLNYFCMDGQSYCICAECVLHGDYGGREVQCLREAVRQLPEKVASLSPLVHGHVEGLKDAASEARKRRQEVDMSIRKGQEELREALKDLAAALRQEEAQILRDADASVAGMVEALSTDTEASVSEAHMRLSQSYKSEDVVQALNWYCKLKDDDLTLQGLTATSADGLKVQHLKDQLSRSFEGRISDLQQVSKRIAGLQSPSVGTAQDIVPRAASSSANGSIRRAEARPPLLPSTLPSPTPRHQRMACVS